MRVRRLSTRWSKKPKQRFYHLEAEGMSDRLYRAQSEEKRVLCLLSHGRILGYAIVRKEMLLTPKSTVLESLWIAPLERGKGYGERLLSALKRRAWLRGSVQLVAVGPFSEAASGFLKKAGAEQTVVPMDDAALDGYRLVLEERSHWIPILFSAGLLLGILVGLLVDRLTLCTTVGVIAGFLLGCIPERMRAKSVQTSWGWSNEGQDKEIGSEEPKQENRYDAATTSKEAEALSETERGRTNE